MKNIAIVHFSGSGHTTLLAQAIQRGTAAVPGVTTTSIRIEPSDIREGRYSNDGVFSQLAAADAILFGSPTYMGGPAAQFKAFADATAGIWFRQGWKDKLAGGFTGSGNPSGDKLSTLQYLGVLAAQHGMIWINAAEFPSHYLGKTDGVNRLGSYLGVMGQNTSAPGTPPVLDPGDALTAEAYGRRVALLTFKLVN